MAGAQPHLQGQEGGTPSEGRPKTTRLRKEERRAQLLEVAVQLFANSSFGSVTTATLAKSAGVTEPVIYQHFASKDELYHAVLRESCQRTLDEWARIFSESPSPLGGLINVARSQFRLMSELWVHYKLHVRAIAEVSDDAVRTILRENDDSYHAFFRDALEKAKTAGEIRKEINTTDVAWFLLSQGLLLTVCRQVGNTKFEASGYLDNLIKTTLAGVSVGAPVVPGVPAR
ncbi:MAG: TetR/AcrR family transcriptional regulator [Planctomycetaceae bacterium]|nr:TetR/AcrR family transcriptional regulator [Planctomycetaceae bacterium]